MIQRIKAYLQGLLSSVVASAKAYVLANKTKSALEAFVAAVVLSGNTMRLVTTFAELGIKLLGKLL